MKKLTLNDLVADALTHLKELGYTEGTVTHYKGWWNGFIRFATEHGDDNSFSTEMVERYLEHRGVSTQAEHRLTSNQRHVRLAMRVLQEFALHGCVNRRRHVAALTPFADHWKGIMDDYVKACTEGRRTPLRCLHHRVLMLRHFFHFLDTRGVKTLSQIDGESLAAFVAKQTHLRPRTVASHVSHLRSFFRHLCMKGLVASSLVDEVPKIRIYRDHRIPTVWSSQDVKSLLAAVDRSSAVGKRDYAILILAAKLGLRAGDIRSLRLDQLNWDRSSLHLTQQKTGFALDVPMPPEVGEALIDYLRHGRPNAEYREVFLREHAPHQPLSDRNAFYETVAKYRRRAGIKLPRESRKGLHALRHSLASRMLEAKVPIDTIAGMLGHASPDTTRSYLRIDIESLRSVAIDPTEVYDDDAI